MPGFAALRGLMPRFTIGLALCLASLVIFHPDQQAARPAHAARKPSPRVMESLFTLYVSPTGRSEAAGTMDDPKDLLSVLAKPEAVPPGSIIWLRGGMYGDGKTYFISRLAGTEEAPIILRQMPGERAALNGSLIIEGAHTWFWGFEVLSTFEDRTGDRYNPQAGTLDGVVVNGPYTKLISLVIHDTREGVAVWTPAEGAEVHDCIIYNNGWQGPDRGHGHGIYTQNNGAPKRLTGNIIFNQFGVGIHAYGSDKAFVRNYMVDHNVVFNNGRLSIDGRSDNLFFGSGGSLSGIRVQSNYTYHTPSQDIGASRVGWQYGGTNQDVSVLDNYFIGGYIGLSMNSWRSMRVHGNVTYAEKSYNVFLQPPQTEDGLVSDWDGNKHYGAGQFLLRGEKRTFGQWRAAGFDANGEMHDGRPRGVWSFVNRNNFDPGRAHIVIYNWDLQPKVCVDVSAVFETGIKYQVFDGQNIFGDALVTGELQGREVCIPMTDLKVVMPLGVVPNPPTHTAPEFGVFVMVRE